MGPSTGVAVGGAGSSPPNAGQYAWKLHHEHSGPGFGRKSSRSQARSTACQSAPTLRRSPRVDCSVGYDVMVTGSWRWRSWTFAGRWPNSSSHSRE